MVVTGGLVLGTGCQGAYQEDYQGDCLADCLGDCLGDYQGGYQGYSGPLATVQVYTISGPQYQLPSLQTPRYDHACTHYLDSQDRMVSTPST